MLLCEGQLKPKLKDSYGKGIICQPTLYDNSKHVPSHAAAEADFLLVSKTISAYSAQANINDQPVLKQGNEAVKHLL